MWLRAISLKQILSHRLLKICRILFVCLSRWYDAANQEKWFPALWMTLHLCDCSTELGGWRFKNSSAYSDAADDCRRILPCGEDGTSSDSFPSPTANRKQGEKNYGDHLQFVFSILGFLNPFWGIPIFYRAWKFRHLWFRCCLLGWCWSFIFITWDLCENELAVFLLMCSSEVTLMGASMPTGILETYGRSHCLSVSFPCKDRFFP